MVNNISEELDKIESFEKQAGKHFLRRVLQEIENIKVEDEFFLKEVSPEIGRLIGDLKLEIAKKKAEETEREYKNGKI